MRAVVARVGLDQRLEALLGLVGAARLQVHGRQARHRREVLGVLGQCGLECRCRCSLVLLQHQHTPLQQIGQRAVGHLLAQAFHGLQRAGQVLLPQTAAHQGQVGARAAVVDGQAFQLGDGPAGIAAHHLRHRDRGAHARVLRRGLGGTLEGRIRAHDVARLQIRLARQRERHAVGLRAVDGGLQHFDGPHGLAATHMDLRQQVARQQPVRRQLDGPRQQHLGLHVRLQAELGGPGQLERGHVVGQRLQQPFGDLARGRVVRLQEGRPRLQEHRVGVVGRHFRQLGEFGARLVELLLLDQDADDGGPCRHRLRARRHDLAVRRQRPVAVALALPEHLALEQPGTHVAGLLRQHVVEQEEPAVDVVVAGLQLGLQHDGRCEARHRPQRAVGVLQRLRLVALHREGLGHAHGQVGIGLGLAQLGAGVLAGDLAELAGQQHRACQLGQQLRIGDSELLRLAQLEQAAGRVAGLAQRNAQHQPRLARLRVLLQRALELDDGGLVVVLRHEALGRCHQLLFGLAAAAGQRERQAGDAGGDEGVLECHGGACVYSVFSRRETSAW